MPSVTVALVLAPSSEASLRQLPAGTPAWIASTPEMQPTLAAARRVGLQVTELYPNGNSPLAWLSNHLDTVDQHHNEFSQTPPYTRLAVFGLGVSPELEPLLREFGFVSTTAQSFGFVALKAPGPSAHSAGAPE